MLTQHQQTLLIIRQKLRSQRRVVCTGNPDRPGTLATGLRKIFPDAVFLCRATGWDLTDQTSDNRSKIAQALQGCNTFFNCSYINSMTQSHLLDICHDTVKFCDVINVGSTHEYDGLGEPSLQSSKLDLRARSLAYNSWRFQTCHFILGGIKKDDSAEKEHWLDIDLICQTMIKIWDNSFSTPMMVMDHQKTPW